MAKNDGCDCFNTVDRLRNNIPEDERDTAFAMFVTSFESDRIPLHGLLASSVLLFGSHEGVRRFRKAVPMGIREREAQDLFHDDLSPKMKAFCQEVFIG